MSRKWKFVLLAIVGTGLVVLIGANLALGDKKIDTKVERLYSAADPQFRHAMGVMLGPGLVDGNRVTALRNGDEAFPAMLAAIRGAQKTVTLETYIYWSGGIGEAFAQALTERAKAGVKVHVIFDAVGSAKAAKKAVERLKEAGVQVQIYNPLRWYTLATMNNRTHRRLLVVDGQIGFTGGVGIADEWSGNAQDPKRWRDMHFRVEGPAVGQMQAAFMENWIEITGDARHGPDYFPPLPAAGRQLAQVFVSSPGGSSQNMQLMYLLSIAAAAKSIRLSAPYFVPDGVEVRMLADAAKRGVSVQILVPGPLIDADVVRGASRTTWGELLRAGVEIYEFMPTLFHVKLLIVDDLWTSVGSTNFDSRSFSVNDEANLNVLDAAFAQEQNATFAEDLKRSRRVTLEDWERRPWTRKLLDQMMGLLSSQL
jgi:cardiolipin synthase